MPRTKVIKAFEVCKIAAGEVKHPVTLEAEIAEQLATQKENDKKAAELELQRINLERDKVATLKFQSEVQLKSISGSGASTPSTSASSTGMPCTISLSEVLDQLSKEVAPLLGVDEINDLHAVYEKRMEGPCAKRERPSDEQLACLLFWILHGLNPYADLAIFGPHQHRLRRKLLMSGLIMAADGTVTRIELKGPPDFDAWLA